MIFKIPTICVSKKENTQRDKTITHLQTNLSTDTCLSTFRSDRGLTKRKFLHRNPAIDISSVTLGAGAAASLTTGSTLTFP